MEQQLKVVSKGEPDVSTLSVEEQKAFYGRLLARVLDLYRQKRESKGGGNGL